MTVAVPDMFYPPESAFADEVPRAWGVIPSSESGSALPDYVKTYFDRVHDAAARRACVSRRHHYVPQCYLRAWSADGRRVRVVDTTLGTARTQGLRDTCVAEDFYRIGSITHGRHNQAEEMLSALDGETATALALLRNLRPGDDIPFEIWVSTCYLLAVQYLRTPQRRRLVDAHLDWVMRQNGGHRHADPNGPVRGDVGWHVHYLFRSAPWLVDGFAMRQLWLYDDPKGRFPTCDSPVLINRAAGRMSPLIGQVDRVWWPLSPTRAALFTRDHLGTKVEFRLATPQIVAEVRQAAVRGRERFIITTDDDRDTPVRPLRKRPQLHIACQRDDDNGRCGAAIRETYGTGPDLRVCPTHPRPPDLAAHA